VLLAKKTLQNLLIVGGSLALNFVLNLMFLSILGLTGAAMAILLSNGFLAGCTIMLSRKAVPILFPWMQVGKMLIAVAIMTVLLLVAKQSISLNNFWGLFFAIVIAGTVYLACYCFSDREMARGLRRLSMS
jgi:O-antigen/teichoic acid export membrane protein